MTECLSAISDASPSPHPFLIPHCRLVAFIRFPFHITGSGAVLVLGLACGICFDMVFDAIHVFASPLSRLHPIPVSDFIAKVQPWIHAPSF
jgi:hypothetical protein